MTKVLIATQKPFAEKAINKIIMVLKQADFEIEFLERYTEKSELLKSIKDADALIIRSDKIDKTLIDEAEKLKIIVRAGAGYDNVDLDAASEKGIVVMNTPGQNSNAVAELAIGLALYGIRNLFSGNSGAELRGKTIGLHGYGYVARNVSRIARGFGMETVVYTRFSKAQAVSEGLTVTDSLEELYAMSDVVSIHVPARGEHIKSVSYDILQHLKPYSIIVNTARKEVINEDDLINFLRFRPDVKYLSDIAPDSIEVFEKTLKGRYFFTPKKMGAQTAEANINAGMAASEQIVNFLLKGDKTFQVN
ncbi:MAG: NAD(P)-dependent oxidoreductase [Prolixibacteraceae bacterium]|jgi:D-3-phosphoglycerate dehydrogenase|nr:NAD(P)-dependent oxidoreductase [Prolixibacteraceae bacterium]